MTIHRFLLLVPVLAATGCPIDGNTTDAGQCACPTPTAAQISYVVPDADAGISATNVEQALDQLAARPIAEPPIGSRIITLSQNVSPDSSLSNTTRLIGQLSCPDPVHDVAIGGACGEHPNALTDSAAALQSAGVENGPNPVGGAARAQQFCDYKQTQPPAVGAKVGVNLVCLRNAR